jgi:hypothetical protein
MESFRWFDDQAAREPLDADTPHLRVVTDVAPRRPQWSRLYATLIAVSGFAVAIHLLLAPHPLLRAIGDGGFALALLASLLEWIHRNRVALARAEEPDAGTGMPSIRIVRSRSQLLR